MITGVTRKAIIELFRTFNPDPFGLKAFASLSTPKPVGIKWWGDLDEIEFLERIYKLEEMQTSDDRYKNAQEDIRQHRYNNNDWENEYIFNDDRFKLQSSDTALLTFLAETLHPEVRTDRDEVNQIRSQLNDLLRPDLYELRQVSVISGKPVLGAVSVEPRKVTAQMLRGEIAQAVWAKGPSAPNLPGYGDSLKLPPSDLEPMASKVSYMKDRLKTIERSELIKLAREVIEDYPYDPLIDLVNEIDTKSSGNTNARPKNLIFAANGPKPEIVLLDSVNNDVKITKNAEYCLIYEEHIDPNQGLSWNELLSWWISHHSNEVEDKANKDLYARLLESCNDAEKIILNTYGFILKEKGFHLPALIPQVYLHFDPLTLKQRGGASPLNRQRMDFLMLLPGRSRVVVELDGIEHYSDKNGKADTKRYADMMREDRRLRLAGYEVYRFGGNDFLTKNDPKMSVRKFFEDLLDHYEIK